MSCQIRLFPSFFRLTVLSLVLVVLPGLANAALPESDASLKIESQEWPFEPGPRQVTIYIYYPGGKLENVTPETGLMLNLHNWGGTGFQGAGDPRKLTAGLDVIAISVDYLQSGKQQDGAPYDFGHLQAIDALRALSYVFRELKAADIDLNTRRIMASGGSGGGNVSLMCNKFAPHTFSCIVDICGMPRLSDDIAFNLPGGSRLDARYSQDPESPMYLSPGRQELHFVGNPAHLQKMKEFGNEARIVVIHGTGDDVCPYPDAVEMVTNMKQAELNIEEFFVKESDVDGKIFKSTGHSLGDRSAMMLLYGRKYLLPESDDYFERESQTDFELQQDIVYPTSDGQYVISYPEGVPSIRFESQSPTE
ncbi:Prolyl oligopeptidase family protein [Polystyrenella longa]|uniref:Prolyl oligopeptidase family protein n=1 Tax=Polystyrenella longa TaxID=2528007 RepID=A0A518CKL0_9PLAN|nr:DUF2920 family protein [Polystyrenella longa]QDU79765.1 Prolyl oligopeptidase family protein [Polystyrenella longa]